MGHFIDGVWHSDSTLTSKDGEFKRKPTTFRHFIKSDQSTPFTPEPDRYHLYVSYACPWAHRTLILRKLKGLEKTISLSVVDPLSSDNGWHFSENPGCIPDTVNHKKELREIYSAADSKFTGRVTVPLLWDKKEQTIVNNESLDLIKMFDQEFESLAENHQSFYPNALQTQIDQMIEQNYDSINNGVYRCGFAGTQSAYEKAATELFSSLDRVEKLLSESQYLCGDQITLADWCLFTTLIRFDLVYVTHFKCNLKQIRDYPNLWNYLLELYQTPGVSDTCFFDHIKDHYFQSHRSVNPKGIVPIGPEIDFHQPHNRTT